MVLSWYYENIVPGVYVQRQVTAGRRLSGLMASPNFLAAILEDDTDLVMSTLSTSTMSCILNVVYSFYSGSRLTLICPTKSKPIL